MAQATIYNGLTGKTVYRDETTAEIAERENLQKEFADKVKEQTKAETVKAEARQAVLDRLGITADEARLLLA
tara:strand:+ start:837 stop:1052 length:216 start_codon:yes stop_codon:yes gene_type:complete